MSSLAPQTLTHAEQTALLQAVSAHPRDHLIFSFALGTGLRLAEIVGLNVGDVYFTDGTSRGRMLLRREIAKGGRAGDVFLPDALMPIAQRSAAGEGARPWTGAQKLLKHVGERSKNLL